MNKLSSTGTLYKLGSGTLLLSASNSTYTGGSVVNAGTLWFTTNAAMGTGLVTVNSGGPLSSGGFSTAHYSAATLPLNPNRSLFQAFTFGLRPQGVATPSIRAGQKGYGCCGATMR